MTKKCSFEGITSLFEALHSARCEYIILRNFEELDDNNFYLSGHADIDFLTSDTKKFTGAVGAVPRFKKDDGIHYAVNISGTDVVIDVRTVGDGYYCTPWEKDMLKKRHLRDGRFYVTDDVNYYHSLVYHAVLQKKALSEEYLTRLNAMAAGLGIGAATEAEHLEALDGFMRKNKYRYTYPVDIWVPLRRECVDEKLVKKGVKVCLRDMKTRLLQTGSRIKHILIHR